MHDAISLDSTRGLPRLGGLARRAWRTAGHALAVVNGSPVARSLQASDMAQMRRAMRD